METELKVILRFLRKDEPVTIRKLVEEVGADYKIFHTAVKRYKKGDIALNRAAEMTGVTTEEMKHVLHERGVKIRRGFVSAENMAGKARELARGA